MSRKFILSLVSSLVLLTMACSSDDSISSETDNKKDSVEVGFSFGGDFDITERPITKAENTDSKVYYHIRVKKAGYSPYYSTFGYVGVFTDLKYARIRLERNSEYFIEGTAFREGSSSINLDEFSTVYVSRLISQHTGQYDIVDQFSVLNKFSSYLYDEEESTGWEFCNHYSGAAFLPFLIDKSVERFYNNITLSVVSNETVNIDLKRYSYILTCEMDAPSEGHIELSCDAPSFKYSIDSNGGHLSKSSLYSLGGTSLSEASKQINLKLEHFNNAGESTDVTTRTVTVKPNVETIVKVNFDKFNADNTFAITFDNTPMGKEELEWK